MGVDADGFVLLSEHRNLYAGERVVRIHPDGRVHADVIATSVHFGFQRLASTAGFVESPYPLDDPGFNPGQGYMGPQPCALLRDVAGGELRRFGFNALNIGSWASPLLDVDAGRFVTGSRTDAGSVRRLARDCAPGSVIELGGSITDIVQRSTSRGAIILRRSQSGFGAPDRLALVDEERVLWDVPLALDASDDGIAPTLVSMRDGVVAWGVREGEQRLQRFRENGSLGFEYVPGAERVIRSVHALGESLLVLGTTATTAHPFVLILAPDGSVTAEQVEARSGRVFVALPQSNPIANDRVLALRDPTSGDADLLFLVDESGSIERGASLTAGQQAAVALDDATVLVSRPDDQGRLLRFDRSSGEPRAALQIPHGPTTFASVPALSVDAGGVSVATGSATTPVRLTRLDASGTVRWQQPLEPLPTTGFHVVEAVASGESITCVISTRYDQHVDSRAQQRADCFADDGSDAYRRVAFNQEAATILLARVDDTSRLQLVLGARDASNAHVLRFVTLAPDGAVSSTTDAPGGTVVIDAERMQVGVKRELSAFPASIVETFDVSGESLFRLPFHSNLISTQPLGLDGAEQVLLEKLQLGETAPLLLEQHTSGQRSGWSREYPQWIPCHDLQSARALPEHDWLIAFELLDPAQINSVDQRCSHRVLARLSGSDGSVLWSKVSPRRLNPHGFAFEHPSRPLLLDPVHAVVATLDDPQIDGEREQRIVWRSLSSGDAVAAASLAHSNEFSSRLYAGADGDVLSIGTHRAPQTAHSAVARHPYPLSQLTLPLSQSGIRGAWSSTQVDGQGLFFDYLPGADRLYGGWFTHRSDGGHEPAGLRWYLLVSDAEEADSEVRFAIERHSAGVFAQTGDSHVERVGHATLRLLDCDRASFAYRFDGDDLDGEEAAIDLRRAAPASYSCVMDGQAASTPVAAPARGMDARLGGAWQIDRLDGQGIAFELRPPQATDAGLFAGAWFSYDPSGGADDPTAQHWFTLSGDLADATLGRVTVPIFRTIGGRLDRESTNNTWRVGTAVITFTGCDSAVLEYAFDPIEVAHAFAGLQGSATLTRVGGCGE